MIAHFPLPKSPMPQHDHDDDMALALLSGILADMRTQAQFLIKCLSSHREIDRDLWIDLGDIARDVLAHSDDVLCVDCLRHQRVMLGRGRGFDPVLCDSHVERQS